MFIHHVAATRATGVWTIASTIATGIAKQTLVPFRFVMALK